MTPERDVIVATIRHLQRLTDQQMVFDVVGTSMWPTLHAADKVTVAHSNAYRRGDLILFDDGAQLVVHRLLDVDSQGRYITKGDNRRTLDAPVSADQILGRVITIVRADKTIPIRPNRQRLLRRFLRFAWLISAVQRRLH